MENLIYKLFNLTSNQVQTFSVNTETDPVTVSVRLKPSEYFCPVCGSKMHTNGFTQKFINHQVLINDHIRLLYHARRYRCPACNHSQFEKNPFSIKGFRTSILVMDNILKDLHNPRLNYTMISQRFHISVQTVVNYLDSFVTIPYIPLPVNLGIDEIHSKMAKRKNASYLGVLIDNDRYNLVEILPTRNKRDLSDFLRLRPQKELDSVEYVTMDMWEPYRNLAYKYFKNAVVAVDPFHVIEHLTFDFTKIRIKVMNKCVYRSNAYYLLKTWHWLLEKNVKNLDGERVYNRALKAKLNYRDLLDMTLAIDEELSLAYHLKEMYRDFNSNCTYEAAEEQLSYLIECFQRANIKEYEEFVAILIKWKTEIVNSFIVRQVTGNRLSNAKTEAMNNALGVTIRIANGLNNFNRFRKRMLFCFNDHVYYSLTDHLSSLKVKSRKEENK